MVQIRATKQKHLTCHAVATVLLRPSLPAGTIVTGTTTIMAVARRKEAAP